MSGEELRFTRNGKEVKFTVGKKVDNKLSKEDKKNFGALFDAIANSDGKKEISQAEFEMLKKLKTIFAKTGANQGENGGILDEDDAKLAAEFDGSGKTIGEFIEAKYREVMKVPKLELAPPTIDIKPVVIDPTTVKIEPVKIPQAKPEPTQADKNASFNRAMQNAAKRYDANELGFTKEVTIDKGTLYGIAKEALRGEGNQNPTPQEINVRIAQIVAANPQITDVNNIPRGTVIKVGRADGSAPANSSAGAANGGGGTGTVPVETVSGGIAVAKDPDPVAEEFAESENAPAPDGVELNGGTLKTYTKGTGEATETKYVYEKDGVKFEAGTVEELKTKIETLKTALEELSKTVEGETAEAKSARIAGAIDKISGLGTESAVKLAQQKLAEQKANLVDAAYAERTIAMLKSGNPALIKQMLGEDGAKFAELVNNNPAVQEAIGEVIKYLNDKFNNDEYLTLDEQAIREILMKDTVKNANGVTIAEKAAVAEVKDEAGNVTTPASAKVFAKTMVTDEEGNSYYKATVKIGTDDVEFRAKDDKLLDEFLNELELATDDAKKTTLFKKYAENCTDTELLKSIVKQTDKLKAAASDVVALINKSNLDLIYAIKTDHFVDTAENEATQTAASTDKTDVTNALKARIEAIMADPELAKLPENAKYIDRVKGLELPAESTQLTRPAEGYIEATGEGATTTETVKNAAGQDVQYTVTKYTKEGSPDIYMVEVGADSGSYLGLKLYAATAKEAAKEAAKFAGSHPYSPTVNEEAAAAAKRKRENLDVLIARFESNPTIEVIEDIINTLKDSNWIDNNDPDAKALVQKLLLTRDAGVVAALTKTDGEVDATLFENDPVAFKTLAAIFKELRDLENQGVRLSKEQIALKDELDDLVSNNLGANIDHGNVLRFDGEGNLAVYSSGPVSNNSANADRYDPETLLSDPILSKDKAALATFAKTPLGFSSLSNKEDQIAFIKLESVDAEILSYIDLSDCDQSVIDAYITKAKNIFKFDTPEEGKKLDPSAARYVEKIVAKINCLTYPDDADGAKKNADIKAIVDSFFTISGEGDNQTATIKDFRRFTLEEMKGLADIVANHGTEAQCKALAAMITQDDMEYGQFVRAIEDQYNEGNYIDAAIRAKYAEFVEAMTTKEEIFELIDKIMSSDYHLPFDTIMAKDGIGTDTAVLDKLISNFSDKSSITPENREKLIKHCLKEDGSLNIPAGANLYNLAALIPQESAAAEGTQEVKMSEDAKKLFKAVVKQTDDLDILESLYNKADVSTELETVVGGRVKELIEAHKTDSAFLNDALNKFGCAIIDTIVALDPKTIEETANKDKVALLEEVNSLVTPYYLSEGHFTDAVVKNAVNNGWLPKTPVSNEARNTGKELFDAIDGPGTDNKFWEISKDEKKINKDTIVDVIECFNQNSVADDGKGIIEWLRDDGVPKTITNRYIKALMRRAEELRLQDTAEFTNLENFFFNKDVSKDRIQPDQKGYDLVTEIFRGSVHDPTGKSKAEYTKEEATSLDTMVNDLLKQINLWSRGK